MDLEDQDQVVTRSACCDARTYVDEVDGGMYCVVCDAEVDPSDGHRLTEPERMRALCERELSKRLGSDARPA